MKNYIVKLTEKEANRLLMIIADEDEKEALTFLKTCLEKQIKEAMRPHCIPVFDQSYKPGQKRKFEIKN
jgi:hypothetical protein